MIDTTDKKAEKKTDKLTEDKEKRSQSLKLALMLIGTMRVISKNFRIHLLKGMLLPEDYFDVKGTSML